MIGKYFEWNENAICALDWENAHSIPIIAMTVNAFDEDVRESLASGMNGHIAKPFNPQELAAELFRRINAQ